MGASGGAGLAYHSEAHNSPMVFKRWSIFIILYCIVLYCIDCIVLYCIVLYCMVWYGMVWHGMVCYGIVLYCIVLIVLYCIVWCCMVRYGMVWYVMVWYRIVNPCLSCYPFLFDHSVVCLSDYLFFIFSLFLSYFVFDSILSNVFSSEDICRAIYITFNTLLCTYANSYVLFTRNIP